MPQPKPELQDAPASLLLLDESPPREAETREMRRFTFVPPQFGHVIGCFCVERTIFSNSAPHFGHVYSNKAILHPIVKSGNCSGRTISHRETCACFARNIDRGLSSYEIGSRAIVHAIMPPDKFTACLTPNSCSCRQACELRLPLWHTTITCSCLLSSRQRALNVPSGISSAPGM